MVPFTDFSTAHGARAIALIVQGAVRGVYALDITIRSVLARRHTHYLLTHPDELMTPSDAARILGLSADSVRVLREVA